MQISKESWGEEIVGPATEVAEYLLQFKDAEVIATVELAPIESDIDTPDNMDKIAAGVPEFSPSGPLSR